MSEFKVGDLVVFNNTSLRNCLLKVDLLDDEDKEHVGLRSINLAFVLHAVDKKKSLRHATEEEIKAGRRL